MLLFASRRIGLFRKCRIFFKCLVSLAISASFVFANEPPSAASSRTPAIVVTIKPIYGLVAALTNGIATPTLLCEGRGSTHTLSLVPSDIKTLSAADLVIWVGESYEMMMAKPLMKAIKGDQLLGLDQIKGITLYPQRTGGLFPGQGCQHCCDHAHDHNHKHDDHHHEHSSIDGHFWLDIENAKICARAIAAVLIQKWPHHKDVIAANLATLESDLTALKVELGLQLTSAQGKIALIDHDSLQYFEKQFGFTIKGVLSDEHGMAPSTKHLEKLKGELAVNLNEGLIKVFFYEGFTGAKPPSLLNNLAEAYSIRLAPLDYVADQLPKSIDVYQACLRAIATHVKAGFEGTA